MFKSRIQKQGYWMAYNLKPKENMLERYKKKSLLQLIVTGDKNWIHYDNPKCRKLCETSPTTQINGKAEYSWRQCNALYSVGSEGCTVLLASKIEEPRCRQQRQLKQAIAGKRPEFAPRHEVKYSLMSNSNHWFEDLSI